MVNQITDKNSLAVVNAHELPLAIVNKVCYSFLGSLLNVKS
jgi:hypothetical protein